VSALRVLGEEDSPVLNRLAPVSGRILSKAWVR